jgi:hypothetical protein
MVTKMLVLKQPEGVPPIPTEVLAAHIKHISDGVGKIRSGRLNEKALLLLVSHASGVAQRDVRAVLDSLADLERTYLKPVKK